MLTKRTQSSIVKSSYMFIMVEVFTRLIYLGLPPNHSTFWCWIFPLSNTQGRQRVPPWAGSGLLEGLCKRSPEEV